MQSDFYDICREVWEWENRHNIPYAARLTEWYGDLAMCVPLPGVNDEQILAQYRKIQKEKPVQSRMVHAKGNEWIERG